jgi:tetratricopeptide (TPR) repeat protein
MGGRRGAKALFVSGAVVLTMALYLAPKKAMKSVVAETQPAAGFDFGDLQKYQEAGLDAGEKQKEQSWLNGIEKDAASPALYDSLAMLWDSKKAFALSGWYYERKAGVDKSEASYLSAAYRFFDAYKSALDSVVRQAMVDGAIRNYEKVLAMNPDNLDAKTDLGVLYAEATPMPMKGIQLLQDVVRTDPGHANAQYNLGILSIRSGQYEKAIQRFDNVLKASPGRTDALLLKGRTYAEMGENEKAIETFEQFKAVSTDPEAVAEVDRLIEKLK